MVGCVNLMMREEEKREEHASQQSFDMVDNIWRETAVSRTTHSQWRSGPRSSKALEAAAEKSHAGSVLWRSAGPSGHTLKKKK